MADDEILCGEADKGFRVFAQRAADTHHRYVFKIGKQHGGF